MEVATQTFLMQASALTGLISVTIGYAAMIKSRARRPHIAPRAWWQKDEVWRGPGNVVADTGWAVVGLLALVTIQAVRVWRAVSDAVHWTTTPRS